MTLYDRHKCQKMTFYDIYDRHKMDDLRKISLTKNLSKLYEALLSESIISDLDPNIDGAQFGNEKGLGITHYLVKMVHQILTILDSNDQKEKYAVIVQLIDWSKAFDRQDPKLGVEAFIKNGVRPTLIPVLISFFQNRKMTVKWNGQFSSERDLPGGVPQGSTNGLLQYKSGSNDNADHVSEDMRFKFVDDLSILEKINLILTGISSYNFKNHGAADIGINQNFISNEHLNTQKSVESIQKWTNDNKAKLNTQKSSLIIINFTESQLPLESIWKILC